MSLIKLKLLSRSAHLSFDERKKQLEQKKIAIDKLQLQLENLLYKQSYLKREINSCKDFYTPNLLEIEKELQAKLGTVTYTENLDIVNSETKELLMGELAHREALQRELDSLNSKNNEKLEIVEKKRKFLDEIPSRAETVRTALEELDKQFVAQISALEKSRNSSGEDSEEQGENGESAEGIPAADKEEGEEQDPDNSMDIDSSKR